MSYWQHAYHYDNSLSNVPSIKDIKKDYENYIFRYTLNYREFYKLKPEVQNIKNWLNEMKADYKLYGDHSYMTFMFKHDYDLMAFRLQWL